MRRARHRRRRRGDRALSPSVESLVAARFVQGLAGAVGIVIAQAAGRDLYSGGTLVRYYGRLTVIGGLAAIVGPVAGGQLAAFTDWRGIFGFLALLGAVILLACLTVFRETLPPPERTGGGLAQSGRDFRQLLSDRLFLGAVLITGFVNAASRERPHDLVFLPPRARRDVSDDASCVVRGHPRTDPEGLLTCGLEKYSDVGRRGHAPGVAGRASAPARRLLWRSRASGTRGVATVADPTPVFIRLWTRCPCCRPGGPGGAG
ncbi:MFS transporter [Streptomyces sp. SAS_269]|uniref:MFS transporter n=1 Tax=Streptomyces sp. SAS_269 TaxID=3412749 RepID=UPI00403C697A